MALAFDVEGHAFVRSESIISFGSENREDNEVAENANENVNNTGAAETK